MRVFLLILFSFGAFALAPFWGNESISFDAVFNDATSTDAQIFWGLRLPRTTLAWMAGGALAVCGAVMQTLLRNGLATPFTLGVSAAGSFGAFLLLAFPALAVIGEHGPRAAALVFALLELTLVLAIARRAKRPDALILAGVTLNFLFGAAVLLVRFLADPFRLASLDRWMMGSLDTIGFQTPISLIPWLIIPLLYLARHMTTLDHLAFDTQLASSRGIQTHTARRNLLLAVGIMTAAIVANTGPIGFIGLLAPHAIRPFTGMRHARLLPAAWLLGSGFLILADAASRTITMQNTHGVLPVGILTALIGGPFFLWMLLRRN